MSTIALAFAASVIAIELNPLALVQLRASGNIVVAVATHHAVVLSPFYTTRYSSFRGSDYEEKHPSFGTELGYRYMFGKQAFDGAFVGPSAIVERTHGTLVVGGALDLGAQTITSWGLVLSAGAGVQWTTPTTEGVEVTASGLVFSQTGLNPRFLVSVGYGF